MKCRNCGSEIQRSDMICSFCGEKHSASHSMSAFSVAGDFTPRSTGFNRTSNLKISNNVSGISPREKTAWRSTSAQNNSPCNSSSSSSNYVSVSTVAPAEPKTNKSNTPMILGICIPSAIAVMLCVFLFVSLFSTQPAKNTAPSSVSNSTNVYVKPSAPASSSSGSTTSANNTAKPATSVSNTVTSSTPVNNTTKSATPATTVTPDPKKGHSISGIVTDPSTGKTYYCWENGTATLSDVYETSGLTWTHPWGQKFFNIYNGSSDNGNVIYSEKACSWCGAHKVFYYSLTRSTYDFSETGLYLCESCHIDLATWNKMCCKCWHYYDKYCAIYSNGKYYCEKCFGN